MVIPFHLHNCGNSLDFCEFDFLTSGHTFYFWFEYLYFFQ